METPETKAGGGVVRVLGASISPGSLGELQTKGLIEIATEDRDLGSSAFSSPHCNQLLP